MVTQVIKYNIIRSTLEGKNKFRNYHLKGLEGMDNFLLGVRFTIYVLSVP